MRLRSVSELRLGLLFLGLVLLPSLLLGFFCFRAVESVRRATRARVHEDQQRYAEFAARAVEAELAELESEWQDLRPEAGGWEARVAAIQARLGAERRAELCIGRAWLVDASGRVATFRAGAVATSQLVPMPASAIARRFESEAAAAADLEDPRAAAARFADLARRYENERLRAIAEASAGDAWLRAGERAAAAGAFRRVLATGGEPHDFDQQPLRCVARLQLAQVLAVNDPPAARRELENLCAELTRLRSEMSWRTQAYFAERTRALDSRLDPSRRLDCAVDSTLGLGADFFVRKLERKLLRAIMDEQPASLRVRSVSDLADGVPYLLALQFLPDAGGIQTGAVLGYEIDLQQLSIDLLPRFLRELRLADAVDVALVDGADRLVAGDRGVVHGAPSARAILAEPFEFWSIAVRGRASVRADAGDARSRALLSVVIVLLLTIVAGAMAIAVGLRRQARQAALKTTFVNNVSHELRTPLTSIRMYAEMLELHADLPAAERQRQLGVIRSECRRLERLIDAVLDFASLQRGTRALQFEYEEVGSLVRQVAEEFREQAESQGFTYRVEIEADLPEIRADADALRQVLLNLLSNAVKYSEATRWIAIRAARRDGGVVLEVEDHGIGIAPAEQERIFEDFYRVDQRLASARPGLGLGLTLVRRIVTLHGGRVAVDSALGRGARFSVWLPLEPSGAGARSASISAGA
jgi:signal transduction histidine kinase